VRKKAASKEAALLFHGTRLFPCQPSDKAVDPTRKSVRTGHNSVGPRGKSQAPNHEWVHGEYCGHRPKTDYRYMNISFVPIGSNAETRGPEYEGGNRKGQAKRQLATPHESNCRRQRGQ